MGQNCYKVFCILPLPSSSPSFGHYWLHYCLTAKWGNWGGKDKRGKGWAKRPCLATRRWTVLYQPMMRSNLMSILGWVSMHIFSSWGSCQVLKENWIPLCANLTSLICILSVLCDWWSDEGPPRFYAKTPPSCCHSILSQVLSLSPPQLPSSFVYLLANIYWLQQWLCCGWIFS